MRVLNMPIKNVIVVICLSLVTFCLVMIWAQQPVPAVPTPAQAKGLKSERFEGILSDRKRGPATQQPSFFILKVNSWSSDEEILALARELKVGGQKALLQHLATLKPNGTLAYRATEGSDMVVTRSVTFPSGERLVQALSDRAINLKWTNQPHPDLSSLNCPFVLVNIRFNAKGKGQGTMLATSQISIGADGIIEATAKGIEPLEFLDVTAKPLH